MARSAHNSPRMGYLVATAMLVLAFLFPVGLMVFNPTLMFERGWEQYVGTAIYLWAVLTLCRELLRLRRDESAFAGAPALLEELAQGGQLAETERRILPVRLRQLAGHSRGTTALPVAQLMELNREG